MQRFAEGGKMLAGGLGARKVTTQRLEQWDI